MAIFCKGQKARLYTDIRPAEAFVGKNLLSLQGMPKRVAQVRCVYWFLLRWAVRVRLGLGIDKATQIAIKMTAVSLAMGIHGRAA